MFICKQCKKDEKRLKKIAKGMQSRTSIDCEKIKYKKSIGFQTLTNSISNIKIAYNKNLDKYKDFELSYVLGHEIAHYEYNTTKVAFFMNKEDRIKAIINELFSDIRGRQLSGISSEEIKEYFVNNDIRYKNLDDLKTCWKWGYLISKERAKFVNQYYEDYINNKLDPDAFGNEVINKYNKMCRELNKDEHCINDNIVVIDWIKKKYEENMKI